MIFVTRRLAQIQTPEVTDLSRQNSDFSSSLSIITKDVFSFIAQSGNPSSISAMSATLEALQDKVHSTDRANEILEKLSSELGSPVLFTIVFSSTDHSFSQRYLSSAWPSYRVSSE